MGDLGTGQPDAWFVNASSWQGHVLNACKMAKLRAGEPLGALRGAAPDGLGGAGREGVVLGPLHKLEVTHGGQLQAQVLQRLPRAVDHRHIQHDVVLVHRHVRLRIHRIC